MSGTNFPTGLVTRKAYSGSTAATDKSYLAANTKFVYKTAVIRCDAQTSETETGFTLPASAIVSDIFLNVITVDATETVDVGTTGTSNDPNGFLALASLATAGLVYGSLADGAVTRGALLFEITEATTAAARRPNITAGGDTISYTCSAGSDTAVFDIIIEYVEVVVEAN
tara:strand:+ start:13373 stop:13882 length:510 start_codon:yes stop_codon:yes gene_type:complete